MKSIQSYQPLPQRNKLALQVLLACLSTGLIAAPVLAQQAKAPPAPAASGNVLEEVVITARKVEEKLLEVPISVLSYSEKEIKASGTVDLYDLKTSAGFNFTQYAATSASGRTQGVLVFRGLQGSTALPQDNSGSLFIDGIFISSGMASVGMTDVARIEVLKGPQNAFFGRSTFGGAVNFITKNPSNTFQGKINTTINNRGSINFDGTVEGPLTDTLKGRLTLVNTSKAASYRAVDGGDLGAEKTKSITGTLYATPSDKLWVRGRLHYQQDDDSQANTGFITGQNNTSCLNAVYTHQNILGQDVSYIPFRGSASSPAALALGRGYFCNTLPTLSDTGLAPLGSTTTLPTVLRDVINSNSINDPYLGGVPKLDHTGLRRDAVRASVQVGYDLPNNADFAFNIGYNKALSLSVWDLDRSVFTNYTNIYVIQARDTTVDARYSTDKSARLRGLLGVSYFSQTFSSTQTDYNSLIIVQGNAGSSASNKSTVPAIYGSVEYDILSNLTVTADIRRQKDKIVSTTFANAANWATSGTIVPAADFTSEKTNILPRLSIKYKFNEDSQVYATRSKGVQPLSLNTGYLGSTAVVKAAIQQVFPDFSDTFSPQPKLESTEIGIKQKLFENRVQYSLAAYKQTWKNRLTLTSLFNPPACLATNPPTAGTAACPLPVAGAFISFGNDATIKGIEFSAEALVMPNWTVGINIDSKDPKWDKYYNAAQSSNGTPPATTTLNYTAVNFNGNTLGWVSKTTAALNSTYRMPNLFSGTAGYVRADVIYDSGAYESDYNFAKSGSYYRANLRAGAERKDWSIELFVKNLTQDKHFNSLTRSTDLGGATPFVYLGLIASPPDPREVGLRFSYTFN